MSVNLQARCTSTTGQGALGMRIHKLGSLIGLSAALLVGPLTAAEAQRPGLYLGLSGGAYSINESNLDENDRVVKAIFGGQFTNWVGLEGSWTDFDRTNNGGDNFDADGKGLAAVFSLPVGAHSAAFLKAGQFWWDSKSMLGGVLGDKDGNDPFYGAGFRFGFNENVALRVEVERYDVSNVHLDTLTGGVEFKF